MSIVCRYKKLESCAEDFFFLFHLHCGNSGAKAVRQLKAFWGSQIGSWALRPVPTENVRLSVKLLIRLRTQ